ncbi:RHS repeat domain-containing protein [Curtobacterium sp. MCPF17_051]|uniref:RHS repeat domain-containing protein n=1 Tax=Curtobacterium sp. MCPF17_051 TaxID=2175640 RepID=UPI0011B83456|nr:RHS repeat-associated core domain-containing protein [Curtobacterium sp. MCPF17_051]
MDTRDGTGGYSTPMAANKSRTVQVTGKFGIPADASAVVLAATVVHPASQGQLFGRADADTPGASLMMVYGGGGLDTSTNSSTLAIGAGGKVTVTTETSVDLVLDVQGYYTSTDSGVAAGGFVAGDGSSLASSVSGSQIPKAQIGPGKTVQIQVTGRNGVPAGASAVAVNFLVLSRNQTNGYITPYATGGTVGSTAMNYPAAVTSSMSMQVPLSADGKMSVYNRDGTIDMVVALQGYFTKSNPGGVFTPAADRLYESKSTTAGSYAAKETRIIKIAGVKSVPENGTGVSAVAVTLTAIHPGANGGTATLWPTGVSRPSSMYSITFPKNTIRSNTAIVPLGADGNIQLYSNGPDTADYIIDLQGYYNALPTGPADTNQTGQRTSATTLPFPITDQTNASVDVGTGNLLVTTSAMSLPGVTQNSTIGAAYNSRAKNVADSTTMNANRWQYALAGAGNLTSNGDGVVYTDAVGTAWQFSPGTTVGTYTSPAGLQQTLTKVDNSTTHEYTLKGWTSNSTTHFNLAGQPTSIVDRNQNQVSFNTSDGYALTSLVSTAGTTGARTANSSYANGVQTFSQTSGSSTRSVSWAKSAAGDITTYTDATGAKTTFAYTNGDLASITAPTGGVTTFTYDSSDRVTQVQQRNTTAGSPGTAVTRFSYADDTTTQVADPRSDQSATVAAAKHTTYTLDGNDLVTKAVDPAKRERSKTYNPANNGVATSQVGADGAAGTGTTTNKYDKNDGQSLTQSQSSSGSTSTTDYASGAATAYLPSKVTSSSKTSTSIGYDGVGNQTSSQSGSDPAAMAEVTYNKKDDGDKYAWGAVKTATAPGNSGNPTVYAYDTNNQLGSITPPTGTSLGAQKYAYDDFGRVKNHTDGGGGVTTYTYDNDDRLLTTEFDDGTATVTNTYDGNGNRLTESSATGTVTNTYDQRNRLTSTVNTAGGGTVSYGYDLAGNTVKVTDEQGTVTHEYDASEVLNATTYPTNSGTAKQLYKTDDHGRRTDTWLNATPNADPAKDPEVWAVHQKLTYDKSSKVTRVQASADSSAPKVIVDTTYCYLEGVGVGSACTATDGKNDRDRLQWLKDNISEQTTEYDYTTKASDGTTSNTTRLQKATQAGGDTNSTWTYTYDSAGNRLTETVTGDRSTSQALKFNAVGQITNDGYSYDGTGNMTTAPGATFTYNGAQQMTSSTKDGKKTTYTYAGADMTRLLSQRTEDGAEYRYTYGKGLTSREVVDSGVASVLADPTTGQPLNLRTTDGTTSMWVLDGIGNPAAAIADTGEKAYTVSYDPYGTEVVTSGETTQQWKQNPFGFKGGIRAGEDNSLTKFGYRWQTATTGGWTQRDTLDAPLDPSNANRYAYAADDPINGSDPSGRAWVGPSFNVCAFICGNVGVSFNDKGIGVTYGWGLGPRASASFSVQGGPGGNTNSDSTSISADAAYGGGIVGNASHETGSSLGSGWSGSGGIEVGAGWGISVGRQYQTQFDIG